MKTKNNAIDIENYYSIGFSETEFLPKFIILYLRYYIFLKKI